MIRLLRWRWWKQWRPHRFHAKWKSKSFDTISDWGFGLWLNHIFFHSDVLWTLCDDATLFRSDEHVELIVRNSRVAFYLCYRMCNDPSRTLFLLNFFSKYVILFHMSSKFRLLCHQHDLDKPIGKYNRKRRKSRGAAAVMLMAKIKQIISLPYCILPALNATSIQCGSQASQCIQYSCGRSHHSAQKSTQLQSFIQYTRLEQDYGSQVRELIRILIQKVFRLV